MLPANIEYDPAKNVLIKAMDNSLTGVSRVKEFALEPSAIKGYGDKVTVTETL